MKYLLPDNEEILLGEELYESTEILFQPELFGFEEYGVVDMIDKCIKASPIDTRNVLFQNIYVYGGNTFLTGFSERIEKDLN